MGRKRKATGREDVEWAEAISGGCLEMDGTRVTAEEAIEAEDSFLRARIERAEEWEREKASRANPPKKEE